MNRIRTIPLLFLLTAFCNFPAEAQFTLVGEDKNATIWVAPSEPNYLKLAVQDMVSDVEKITGRRLTVVSTIDSSEGDCVMVGTLGNAEATKAAAQRRVSLPQNLAGQWEAYRVESHPAKGGRPATLVITGGDARGTTFGVYDFIHKYLGVDPLYFWKDRELAKRQTLRWASVNIRVSEPTFRFRGWFINDEDLLTEWMESGGVRKLDYPFYGQVVNPEAIKHVMEAAVRLRMNLIIPASFVDIGNPAEARLVDEAARRGLFVSMHHVEPMGVSAFTFFNRWEKEGRKPKFSFYSSRAELVQTWKEYAAKWAKYPNVIWQIGLRGIADRPMWQADAATPQSDAERGALITEAMRVQMGIIREATKDSAPVVTTTLWGEGSEFFRQGHLKIPPAVIAIFSDNSPGWRWQKDFYETPREAGRRYGVYYHHQLWGSGPHLAQGVPPAKTYAVLKEAVGKGSTEYAIMNVSNLREFVLGLQASAEMLYDFKRFDPQAFMRRWAMDNFGNSGAKALQAYQAYFAAFQTPDAQPVPFLLDGQLRRKGLDALTNLLLSATDPDSLQRLRQKQAAADGGWSGYISDMHPPYAGPAELQTKLEVQQLGFRMAQTLAIAAAAGMNPQQKILLETNLKSHLGLMTGLGAWLTNILEAQSAYDQNRGDEAVLRLEKAVAAFTDIKAALATNAEGKWRNWYRGDKKMNLTAMETQTARVLAALKNVQSKKGQSGANNLGLGR